ncbi:hypothetical protein DAMNIGENAA_07120 [Desulforhabdus amnigena]|uniref:Uncharacterized protein n=1 Tax=Desulforhabdus amnigena TaxID=40218 RepID=A0A9W6D1K4_9BACT|nr:hypothetical protein [Desulforhabdus amnigena]GLI33279.1 hypothetical protein DAMNIGENAA_07120 [Desulforhabdus amnigena]
MMDVSQFLAECLLLDLETRGDKIDRIGAIRGDAVFERKGRFDLRRALRELDVFSAGVPYLLGHNLLDHDVPTLHRVGGQLQLLKKPVVDTLFLSPLAFPENPYHRLVKDYKLVKEALNDPVADARLAASLFRDEWERFTFLQNQGHWEVLSLYRTCFDGTGFGGEISQGGFVSLFKALGVSAALEKDVPDLLIRIVGDRVCRAALADVLGECFRHMQERTALAYAVAWLERAGFLERNHNETRVFQGKVQVLQVDDGHHQAMAFVSELQRLRQLKLQGTGRRAPGFLCGHDACQRDSLPHSSGKIEKSPPEIAAGRFYAAKAWIFPARCSPHRHGA